MANIKQQKKRIKTNEKARIRNGSYKSKLRTAMKAVRIAVEKNDIETAKAKLTNAFFFFFIAESKGIVHKATAAREKSNLQRLINKAAK